MRKFLIFTFGIIDLGFIAAGFVMREPGAIIPVLMVTGYLLALITNTDHLIPGDAETELYRIRMMMQEQERQRNQR